MHAMPCIMGVHLQAQLFKAALASFIELVKWSTRNVFYDFNTKYTDIFC